MVDPLLLLLVLEVVFLLVLGALFALVWRSSARLNALMVDRLSLVNDRAMSAVERLSTPPAPSPLEVAQAQAAVLEVERSRRADVFDESDPLDGMLPPVGRPSAAVIGGDDDSPFGVPGLALDREVWTR